MGLKLKCNCVTTGVVLGGGEGEIKWMGLKCSHTYPQGANRSGRWGVSEKLLVRRAASELPNEVSDDSVDKASARSGARFCDGERAHGASRCL